MEGCTSQQGRIDRRALFAACLGCPYLGCSLTIHRICYIHSARERSFSSPGSTRTETEAHDLLVPSQFSGWEPRPVEKPTAGNSYPEVLEFPRCLRGPGTFLDSAAFPSMSGLSSFVRTSYPGFIRGICCIVTNYVEAASTRLENLIATYGIPEPLGGALQGSCCCQSFECELGKLQFTFLHWFFFLFFHLARNLIVVIFALQLFLIFFRHLSMNRLSLWRSGAALMFLMHYRIGDPICFLLVLVTGLAHRKFHLRPWSRRGSEGATPFVIGFGLDFIRVLLHHVSQFVSQ